MDKEFTFKKESPTAGRGSIKGTVTYMGEIPVHTLKKDWFKGMSVPLEELQKIFGEKCPASMAFVPWFDREYLRPLGRDFVVDVPRESVLADEEAVAPEEEIWDDQDNVVMVESSNVEVASSINEATERLRKMRHPDVVGEIDRDYNTVDTNVTDAERIRSMPKPGTMVMTGDDLEGKNVIDGRNKRKSGFMFNSKGDIIPTIPTAKEEQERINNQMSGLANRVKYLQEDPDTNSLVVTGDHLQNNEVAEKPVIKSSTKENTNKRNKNYKGFTSFEGNTEILPDHIVQAETDAEASRLIKLCNNSTTLRVAKIYLENLGRHKLIEKVEDKIRSLPPGQ